MSSKVVDERIVEMKFDNKNFERNVDDSIKSIDKLKASLDFSAVEIAAMTAISNITNKLTDMGINLAKSLSVDNLTAGWAKYESRAKSVGTLLSQGMDIDSITEQVEKLQWFTDETSYSFDQMFANVTKFTATGKSLEDSVYAMMGIAEWAAATGQNTQTASQVMYQLAQAMGTGVVKWQDWTSVITHNMVSTEVEQIFADMAAAMADGNNTLTKLTDGTYKTMDGTIYKLEELFTSDALTGQMWLTADVFMAATKQMAGAVDEVYTMVKNSEEELMASEAIEIIKATNDQITEQQIKFLQAAQEARTYSDAIGAIKEAVGSQWSQVWDLLFGDYKTSVKLWTNLSNEMYEVFVTPISSLVDTMKIWRENDGWESLFYLDSKDESKNGALWNMFYAFRDIVNIIKNGWNKVFGVSGEQLASFTKRLKEGTAYLRLSQYSMENLTDVVATFAGILKTIGSLIKTVIISVKPIFSIITDIAKKTFTFFNGLIEKTSKWIKDSKIIENIASALTTVFTGISDIISAIVTDENTTKFFEGLNSIFEKLLNVLNKVVEIFKDMFGTLAESGKNIVSGVTTGIKNSLGPMKRTIKDMAEATIDTFNKTLQIQSPSKAFERAGEFINEGLVEGLENTKDKVKNEVKTIGQTIGETFSKVASSVKDFFVNTLKIQDVIESLSEKITNFFTKLSTFFNNIKPKLKEFGKSAVGVFNAIGSAIGEFVIHAIEKFTEFNNSLVNNSIFSNMESTFEHLFDSLVALLIPIINLFTVFVDTIASVFESISLDDKSPVVAFVKKVGELFSALFDLALKVLPEVTKFIGRIIDKLKSFGNNADKNEFGTKLEALFGAVLDIIVAIIDRFIEFFKDLASKIKELKTGNGVVEKIIEVLPYVAIGLLVKYLLEELTITGRFFKSLKSMSWITDGFSDMMYGAALMLKAKALQSLCAGLLAVAEAFMLISFVPVDKLIWGSAIFGTVLAIIFATTLSINTWMKKITALESLNPMQAINRFTALSKVYLSIGSLLIAFGTGLLLLALSFKVISDALGPYDSENPNEWWVKVGTIMGIMAVLLASVPAITIFAKYFAVESTKLATSLVLFSASVAILAGALVLLARAWDKNFGAFIAGGVTILLLGAALIGVSIALKKFAIDMSFVNTNKHNEYVKVAPDLIKNMAIPLVLISASVAILGGTLTLLARAYDKYGINMLWGGLTLIALGTGCFLLQKALIKFAEKMKDKPTSSNSEKAISENLKAMSANLVSLGTALLTMSVALMLLAIGVKYIGLNNLLWASLLIGILTAIVVGLSVALSKLSKIKKDFDVAKIGETILSCAAAVLIISAAMVGIAAAIHYLELSPAEIATATILVTAIGLMLTGVIAALKLIDKEKFNPTGISKVLLSLSVSILLIAGVIAGLALLLNYTDVNLLGPSLIVIGSMISLALLLMTMSKILSKGGVDWKGVINMLLLMAGICGTVMVVALALKQMEGMGVDAILAGVGILIALISFAGLLAVLSKVVSKISDIKSLINIIAMMGILAGSIMLVALALKQMEGILGNTQAVTNFAIVMGVLIASLASMMILSALAVPLGAGIGIIVGAFAGLSVSLLAIATAMSIFINSLTAFADKAPDEISNSMASLATGLKNSIDSLSDILSTAALMIIDFFDTLLVKALEWIKDEGKVRIIELIGEIFGLLVEALFNIGDHIGDLVSAIRYIFEELMIALGLYEQGDSSLPFLEFINKTITKSLIQSIYGLIEGITAEIPTLVDKLTNFLITLISELGKKVGPITEAVINFVIDVIDGVAHAIVNTAGRLHTAIVNMGKALISALIIGVFGQDTGEKIAKHLGLELEELEKVANDYAKEVEKESENIGHGMIEGIAKGAHVKSPSTAAIEVGEYVDEGLIIGLENNRTEVESKAISIGETITSAIRSAIEIFNSDPDNGPVIRPVMDLSNIQNGMTELGSIFGSNNTISLANSAANGYSRNKNAMPNVATSEDIQALESGMTAPAGDVYNVTMNITGNNPKEIAAEVNKALSGIVVNKITSRGEYAR